MTRHVHLRLPLSIALAAMGCSSAVTPTQRIETTYIPGAAGAMSISAENGSVSAVLPAPRAAVWQLLPLAFDSVGIQLSIIDPKKYVIGNEGFKIRAKLGQERLSSYFECGTTQVGPNADSYEVYMTVLADVQPVRQDTTRTRVTVNITAAAKPLMYSQDYSRCTSKTMLERRILDALTATLPKK